MMDNNNTLIEMIKRHEGLRLKPYRCSERVLTVGFGHNLKNGITKNMATYILWEDLRQALKDTENLMPYLEKDTPRHHAFVNMMFNLGYGRMKGFRNMLAAAEMGDWKRAAKEILDSKWHKQVGDRAVELAWMVEYNKYKVQTA